MASTDITVGNRRQSPRLADAELDSMETDPMIEVELGKRTEECDSSAAKQPPRPPDNKKEEEDEKKTAFNFIFCAVGLQASFLVWGYVQEKVMTTEYTTGKFPSATFCVLSNRTCAIVVALLVTLRRHGTAKIEAPLKDFAPCSISNSLSSFGQYQALRYVSFPLQTLSKSTKVIPVMLMGKVLNGKSYSYQDYLEAVAISVGVAVFSLSENEPKREVETQVFGGLLLALYIAADSFTSQWQSRVFKDHPSIDQFQMMLYVNMWSIVLTFTALVVSGELWVTIGFLFENPWAIVDNVTIAVTSATGQLFIFSTIKTFGPVMFTLIMTTRQMLSLVLSAAIFGHSLGPVAYVGAGIVFAVVFWGAGRRKKR